MSDEQYQIIDVPGHGEVEFPVSMSDADITAAIHRMGTESQGGVSQFLQGAYNKLPAFSDLPEGAAYLLKHPIDSAKLLTGSLRLVSPEDYAARVDAHRSETTPLERLGEGASILGQLAIGAKAPAIAEGAWNGAKATARGVASAAKAIDPVDAVTFVGGARVGAAANMARDVRGAMRTAPEAPPEPVPAPSTPTPSQPSPAASTRADGMSAKDWVKLRQGGMTEQDIASGWAEHQASKPAPAEAPPEKPAPTEPPPVSNVEGILGRIRAMEGARQASATQAPMEAPPGIIERARRMAPLFDEQPKPAAEPPTAPAPAEPPAAPPAPTSAAPTAAEIERIGQHLRSQMGNGAPPAQVPTDAEVAAVARYLRNQHGSEAAGRMLYGQTSKGFTAADRTNAIKKLAPGDSKLPEAAKAKILEAIKNGSTQEVWDYINRAPNQHVRDAIVALMKK